MISAKKELPVIALTGGPCAGKTTMFAVLQQRLEDLGKKVFLVPEAATLLINGGIVPWELPSFQKQVLRTIIDQENRWLAIAKEHPATDKVIITDRGAPEGSAYVGKDVFWKIIKSEGHSFAPLRDGRYDAVIHMRSAAVGAESFYTTSTNTARKETLDEARALDHRTMDAWLGHPHLRVIENGPGGFEEKKRNTLAAICGVLGIPEPLEIERKFLINKPDFDAFPVRLARIPITQWYLRGGGRIRMRGTSGGFTYYYTMKNLIRPGVNVELERRVSHREFLKLAERIDTTRYRPIVKNRYCFVFDGQYFELDVVEKPFKRYLLELELGSEDDPIHLPPFVDVIRDVTLEKEYSNREMARIRRPI